VNRRRFLRTTLWGSALLGLSLTVGKHLSGYSLDAETTGKLRVLSPKEFLVLRAAVRRLVATDAADAPDADALGVAHFVDSYLEKLPAAMRSDFRALLHLLEHGTVIFRLAGSRFTRMSAEEQDRTLADWESSRLAVRRQGFQALKTMALLGYWRSDQTWPLIGYSGPMLPKAGPT
jgi:hypothetical protein